MGYLTTDGKLVPRNELPEDDRELLRRELGTGAEEAAEGGAGGEAAPAPEDAEGPGADEPVEEVAP